MYTRSHLPGFFAKEQLNHDSLQCVWGVGHAQLVSTQHNLVVVCAQVQNWCTFPVLCRAVLCCVLCCRAYLDEVVREPVELGYTEWLPPGAATPPRSDLQMQMSPMGGSNNAGQGPPQAGDSPVMYGSGTAADVQQQYGSTNGNAGRQYARTAGAGAAAVAARYAHGMGTQSTGAQQGLPVATPSSQVRLQSF